MGHIDNDTQAILHRLVAGEDTIKELGRLEDLVGRFITFSSTLRPEYFITVADVEYGAKQVERWARTFGLVG
jgi:hypothetical protein